MKYERHGMSGTPEYRAWVDMRSRCNNPNNKKYPHYGGRGITVCDEWNESFTAFYGYIGRKPEGASLDRINNELGYQPGNVRWATDFEQNNNTRFNLVIGEKCRNGHPVNSETLMTESNGSRRCRECFKEWTTNYNNRDEVRRRRKEYDSRPEVKKRRSKSSLEYYYRKKNEGEDRYVRNAYCILAT